MTVEQQIISGIVACALVFFIHGRWRYDLVALAALLAAVSFGLIPIDEAFAGFGHPAVITVIAVLIVSRALANSGAIEFITGLIEPATRTTTTHIAALSGIAAAFSAFMNNVGALALLLPTAMQSAIKAKRPPGILLMPLSFGSILGGLITLIGTPPNIIVATYRGQVGDGPFEMFDFTPVGLAVALAGLAFITLGGWRLIPRSHKSRANTAALYEIEEYVSELRVTEDSKAIGLTVRELEDKSGDDGIRIVGLIRREQRRFHGLPWLRLAEGDLLIVEANPTALEKQRKAYNLKFVGIEGSRSDLLKSDDVTVMEAVVPPRAKIEGRTPKEIGLRRKHGVNLIAVSRQGRPFRDKMDAIQFRAGDVMLLQGDAEALPDVITAIGCLPLAGRDWVLGKRHLALPAAGIFILAVTAAALGFVPLVLALCLAAGAMVMINVVPPRELYDAVDWPVVVLLGAMVPVAGALESTGTTELLAEQILAFSRDFGPVVILGIILVVTMTLSDIMNNAATAVVMAPISYGLANSLGVNPDAFLMAVALGASCAFLTPIGHQNNTLILGPGGYSFGDYWRLGLPLELLIVAVGLPALITVWPL
ncbi:SLC13 family permease [Oceanibacterium hippocampi]|uniref:Sodium-dependent dicarboxylate transporter SdcS n=1 Tax=Oceanibacterium hippocampi TaxID=745714 RepID=A0A1Y5RW26_9PROT|nr:SLC13 family permease [Oceanibacterium hippocampi]SLN25818.1 Sodium-dependent dicarboxylate transporter SdcS [Oceanibacterium hippocampi]